MFSWRHFLWVSLALIALHIFNVQISKAAPPPKPAAVFEVVLTSPTSAVLFQPVGPCKALYVLVTPSVHLKTRALVKATFPTDSQLLLDGHPAEVDQFVTITAPGCTVLAPFKGRTKVL